MDLVKTHFLIAQEEEQKIQKEPYSLQNPNGLHGDGSFWDGANLMGILNTIGGTWSQIEQAKNGKPVYVQNASGQMQDMSPIIDRKIKELAAAQNTTEDRLMNFLRLQHQVNPPQAPEKDNTLLYVGIGTAGVLAFGTIIYLISKK